MPLRRGHAYQHCECLKIRGSQSATFGVTDPEPLPSTKCGAAFSNNGSIYQRDKRFLQDLDLEGDMAQFEGAIEFSAYRELALGPGVNKET